MAQNQKESAGRGEERGLQREQRQGTLARRLEWPSFFNINPIEFLTMSPFALMRRFTDEFDRLAGVTREVAAWVPPIDIRQEENQLAISADLPGVKPEDVRVEVTDEGLLIEGERRREHEERGEGYQRSERSYGKFQRLIGLPEGINPDNIKADFKNGVLEVRVPLPPEQQQQRKRIPIQVAGQ
jgi:Molecular chaperone (small heat shock protein)